MDLYALMIRGLLFPLMEVFKGNKIRKNLQALKSSQNMPGAQLHDLQEQKLKLLLLHCIESVPAYGNNAALRPLILENSFDALRSFPVLTKSMFRTMNEEYISQNADKSTLIANKSGGSTGEPVKFFIDRHTVEYYEAARWRGLSWYNIKIGDRSAMIWGSPIELSQNEIKKFKAREKLLKNRIMFPAYDLNPDSVKGYVETLNSYKPVYVYGYASSLALFSDLVIKTGLKLDFVPKAVISTSETIYEFQREEIKKAFKCLVVNEYGARDGGILAYECKKGRMHIPAENLIMEILDPKTKEPVEAGGSGLVVVTDLNNFSMPRLRYQLGDMGALASDPVCSCGVGLPVMERLEGREDDMFISMNGSYVHGHYFNHIVRSMESFKQFQIIQKSPTEVLLKIIKSQEFKQTDLDILTEGIKKALRDVNLRLEFVDSISLTASGKIRYAIRDFPL